ncbi:hypothetical protein BGZ94_003392, partial [Podila epigama]
MDCLVGCLVWLPGYFSGYFPWLVSGDLATWQAFLPLDSEPVPTSRYLLAIGAYMESVSRVVVGMVTLVHMVYVVVDKANARMKADGMASTAARLKPGKELDAGKVTTVLD